MKYDYYLIVRIKENMKVQCLKVYIVNMSLVVFVLKDIWCILNAFI